jgi:hypothetical protein
MTDMPLAAVSGVLHSIPPSLQALLTAPTRIIK